MPLTTHFSANGLRFGSTTTRSIAPTLDGSTISDTLIADSHPVGPGGGVLGGGGDRDPGELIHSVAGRVPTCT